MSFLITYIKLNFDDSREIRNNNLFLYTAKAGLQLDTLDEDRLKKIKQLESYERPTAQEAELELQKPVFLTPLNR